MVSRMRDRIDGWWNVSSTADDLETSYFFSGSSSSNLASIAMLRHREGYFLLDRAFPLIEGHPAIAQSLDDFKAAVDKSRGESIPYSDRRSACSDKHQDVHTRWTAAGHSTCQGSEA